LEQQAEAQSKTVSIQPLKRWVLQNLPNQSKLRQLILSEKETLSADEFIIKVESWLLLMQNESSPK